MPESIPIPGLAGLKDPELGEIQRRREMLYDWETMRRGFRAAGRTMAEADKIFLETHPEVSLGTLYAWKAKRDSGDPRELLDKRSMIHRAGVQEPGVEAWKRFKQLWLTRQCRTVSLCFSIVANEAKRRAEDPAWTWLTYRRICEKVIKDLPPIVADYWRLGEREWARKWGKKNRRDYCEYRAGETWISDFHDCDTFCRRSDTDPRIVRPKICTFSDLRTRMIMGWRVVPSENQDAVLLTFRDGVLEFGPPEEAIIDNGKPYRARGVSGGRPGRRIEDEKYVRSVFGALEVRVHFSLPYNPDSKPLERWHLTYETQFGATFASYCGGDNKSPVWRAAAELARRHPEQCPTVAEYASAGRQYINAFNERPHRGVAMRGLSPAQAFAKFDPIPKAVAPEGTVDLLLKRLTKPVTVSRFGVRYLNVEYGQNNQQLFMMQGQEVLLRVDPQDASYVIVCDLEGRPILKAINNRLALNKVSRDDLSEAIREQQRAKKTIKQMQEGAARVALQDITTLAIQAQQAEAQEHRAATGTYDSTPRNIRALKTDFTEAVEKMNKAVAPTVAPEAPCSWADVEDALDGLPEPEPQEPVLSLADLDEALKLPGTGALDRETKRLWGAGK